ncbi:YfhO family protein [Polynucleobacter sp. IMCC 29146]|uniref:YfhO family protein n=1 Tax=Polynucleobacter sp. IMCC 29146 TaxID=2780953 RepID=UPI001F1C6754|nr:YfhO family protein [Polynucleobacter sp. IMCC 29146]MCE7530721.1 YfhO family protein [Polynucleobacter sp. IMCC 29146]
MLNIPPNTFSIKNKGIAASIALALCVWLVTFQDKFTSLFSKQTLTGWDTHSYGFVYFLYFSDALKSGFIPLWNPLIQSGNFFPNFFNAGLFYPFELFFVILGWAISPLLSFELMIQASIIIGALGAYWLLQYWKIDSFLALIGAIFYALIVLAPVVGQIWYTISFASLPWLIFASACLSDKKPRSLNLSWLFFGLLYVFFISGGYLWLNLMNLLLAFSFVAAKQIFSTGPSISTRRFSFYWLTEGPVLLLLYIACIYACIVLPCFLHLQFNYSEFLGDFASPDGRLRGLKLLGQTAGHGGALETIIGNIDPLISANQSWAKEGVFTYGGGWTLWILLTISLITKWTRRQIYWLVLLGLVITYSAGSDTLLGSMVMHIPIVNGNRYWLGVGTSYASIFLLFLVIDKLNLLNKNDSNKKSLFIRLIIVAILGIAFLIYMYAPPIEYCMLISSSLFLGFYVLSSSRRIGHWAFLGLVAISLSYNLMTPYRAYSNPILEKEHQEKIVNRQQAITVTQNYRQLATGTELNYYDTDWIYQKLPFTHGYNHLGNPLYWYVKNSPFLESMVVATQLARPALEINRHKLKSDNEYAEKIAADVLSDPLVPTIQPSDYKAIKASDQFASVISNLEVNPNNVQFTIDVNAPTHIILNMLYAPGWRLTINGKIQASYSANHLFQGVDLDAPGKYQIDFHYRPYLSIALLSAPYALLALLCLITWRKRARSF